MSARDQKNDPLSVTRVEKGRVQCPYCGRWNEISEMMDWYVEYDGHGKYSMFNFIYCIRCEEEVYVNLEFTGLKVKEERTWA